MHVHNNVVTIKKSERFVSDRFFLKFRNNMFIISIAHDDTDTMRHKMNLIGSSHPFKNHPF